MGAATTTEFVMGRSEDLGAGMSLPPGRKAFRKPPWYRMPNTRQRIARTVTMILITGRNLCRLLTASASFTVPFLPFGGAGASVGSRTEVSDPSAAAAAAPVSGPDLFSTPLSVFFRCC